jgi:hypothetical protein
VWRAESNSRCQNVVMSLPQLVIFLDQKSQHLFRSLLWTRGIKNQLPEVQLKAALIKKSNLKIFTQITLEREENGNRK